MGTQQTVKMWVNISEYWQCQTGIIMSDGVKIYIELKWKCERRLNRVKIFWGSRILGDVESKRICIRLICKGCRLKFQKEKKISDKLIEDSME